MPSQDAVQMPPSPSLARACSALWLATLSLMTAFMQNTAPAHRYLLARRISRNLQTLGQQDCFAADCRQRFVGLAGRWSAKAEGLAGEVGVRVDYEPPSGCARAPTHRPAGVRQ